MSFKIIHISDLHFHCYPRNIEGWLSKRALGAANLFFRRQRHFPLERAKQLVEKIQSLDWDHLVISGDITTLALEEEFQLAHQTLLPLLKDRDKVTIIPGNHDRYVQSACSPDLFQIYFGDFFSKSLFKTIHLTKKWHLIGWESTHPNDWLTASGTVSRETLIKTETYIQEQPSDSCFILVNHYPIWFPRLFKFKPNHELHNLTYVQEWIQHQPQIFLYLHGHIHKNWHTLLPRSENPLYIVNSASSTAVPTTPKQSSFHSIQLEDTKIKIEPLHL